MTHFCFRCYFDRLSSIYSEFSIFLKRLLNRNIFSSLQSFQGKMINNVCSILQIIFFPNERYSIWIIVVQCNGWNKEETVILHHSTNELNWKERLWWVLGSARNEVEKIKLARQGHKILKLIILLTRDIWVTFFYGDFFFFYLSDPHNPMAIRSGINFFFSKC